MSYNSSGNIWIFRVLPKPTLHIALIFLTGVLAYSNTFNVPFVFDDHRTITENHLIKNLGNFWPPAGTRWFGTLTFALNYAVGKTNVSGYHFVNLVIHLMASLLVYRLVWLTFKTPLFHDNQNIAGESTKVLAPFVAAFLFVSHPVQTQAVTYIVQRYASLAALLFLAALVCYIQASLAHISFAANRRKVTLGWCVAAMTAAVLAMKTKEIAFTLPIVIALFDFSFFPKRSAKERLCFLVPAALTLLIVPLTLASVSPNGVVITSSAADMSRHDYLLTQFRVIVTYLRLLIFPVNQMFDYTYPILRKLSDPAVLSSFGLLLALFSMGLTLLLRGRNGTYPPELCFVGFGLLWFFITLSIESSVIPIIDVIFEHRLYLPSAGIFMAAALLGSMTIERLNVNFPKRNIALCFIVAAILCVLPVTTYFRNNVWRSELALWEDVVNKSANNPRALAIVGAELIATGNTDQAIEHFQAAIRIKPDYTDAAICLGNAYMDKGMLEEGYRQFLAALGLGDMDSESRAELFRSMGNYHLIKGETERAIYYYRSALSIVPNGARIHFDLARAYKTKGMATEAANEFARARQLSTMRN